MDSMPEFIVVVDVESTCWTNGTAPAGQTSEIIEIGVCIVDVKKQLAHPDSKRSILVRPVRSRVSDFCTKLTTLTQSQVEEGILFWEACKTLEKDFHSDSRPWGSFGDYDRKMLIKQCEATNVKYPFTNTHLNIKKRFAELMGLKKELGMDGALQKIGIPLLGTHHRGGDDSW
nr:3'-5' exonuclease [Candidatus Sigynarchaeota archaeon]